MGQPAAKKDDEIMGTDQHTIPGTPPQVLTFLFIGPLSGGLSVNVSIEGKSAAVQGSTAITRVVHPTGSNLGTIAGGSQTVLINGKPAARNGDRATTCDELGRPGQVVASGTVLIGG